MKYYFATEKQIDFNAGTKAVNDTVQILQSIGYSPFPLGLSNKKNKHSFLEKLQKAIMEFYHLIFLFFKDTSNDIYFLQWPFYHIKLVKLVYWVIKLKCKHLQILIHDINSLRNSDHLEGMDIKFFSIAELIIVHTENMKKYLIAHNISNNKIKVLTSFDYITTDKLFTDRTNSTAIVYAGNLTKSLFLNKITPDLGLTINCYGKEMPYSNKNLIYKGAFLSDNVSVLKGSWGLVWDGISISTCEGDFGNYLKYNSPHKLSLYIAAGLPVIVWKESGLAEYITSKKIGVVVNSINEIIEVINNISANEYKDILINIEKESLQLRTGRHLLSCLND